MKLIRHPWVWFLRFRHRRGYGVHSPFAFAFLSGVVYEHAAYYAYERLNKMHPWWVRWGGLYPLTCRRLLFRLANFAHPHTIRKLSGHPIERAYLAEAVPSAQWVSGVADLVFLPHESLSEAVSLVPQMPPCGMMVLEGIHANQASLECWQHLLSKPQVGVTFDLYTYGILFFDLNLTKQHYLVNF